MKDEGALAVFERKFVRPKEGRTLIVGSQIYGPKEDRRKRYTDALGVDMLDGPGVDRVIDLEQPLPDDIGMFDHIECMSVLEHSRRPWLLADNLQRVLKDDGTIFVSVPWVWRYHPYDKDFWRMSHDAVRSIFSEINWVYLMYASDVLSKGHKVRSVAKKGHPYLARTETVAFGVRHGRPEAEGDFGLQP